MPAKGRGRKRQGPRADSSGRRNSSTGFYPLRRSAPSIGNEGSRLSNKHSHENITALSPQNHCGLRTSALRNGGLWAPPIGRELSVHRHLDFAWIADLGATLKCSSRESGERHRIQCDGIRGLVKLVWRPLLSTRQVPMFAPAHLYCARSRVFPTPPQALIVLLHRVSKRPFG